MKKIILLVLSISMASFVYAQVGINTTAPQASLHVVAEKTDGTTPEGIIAPTLTRAQLISKNSQYTSSQDGAFVYISTLNGTASGKTAHVTATGYYYYDGTNNVWKPFSSASGSPTTVGAKNGLTINTTDGDVEWGGTLIQATDIIKDGNRFRIMGTNSTNTIQGATNLSQTLNVSGKTTLSTVQITGGTPGLNKVLTSDASGNATWQTAATGTSVDARNGVNMNSGYVELGGTLINSTTDIVKNGNAFRIMGTNSTNTIQGTTNIAGNTAITGNETVSGTLGVTGKTSIKDVQINTGSPEAGMVLTATDTSGNATWLAASGGCGGTSGFGPWLSEQVTLTLVKSGTMDYSIGYENGTLPAGSYAIYYSGTIGNQTGFTGGGSYYLYIDHVPTSVSSYRYENGWFVQLGILPPYYENRIYVSGIICRNGATADVSYEIYQYEQGNGYTGRYYIYRINY